MDSADGRFLIWKIAAKIALDSPMVGYGWENVGRVYGDAQEQYFASGNATEKEMLVAAVPECVFNEYLQLIIAFGPIISLILIVTVIGSIIVAFRNHSFGMAGSAMAIAIVMCASYPLQFNIFIVSICIVVIGCFLSSKYYIIRIIGVGITICGCTFLLANNKKPDIDTEFNLGHILQLQGNNRTSNSYLIPLLNKSSDPMILNIIGKNYQALGMSDSAEYYFRKSTFRCPNRMYPHYLLMKLYADTTSLDRQKCLKEANTILTMKVKIPSPATDEMQQEAKVMINHQ